MKTIARWARSIIRSEDVAAVCLLSAVPLGGIAAVEAGTATESRVLAIAAMFATFGLLTASSIAILLLRHCCPPERK